MSSCFARSTFMVVTLRNQSKRFLASKMQLIVPHTEMMAIYLLLAARKVVFASLTLVEEHR